MVIHRLFRRRHVQPDDEDRKEDQAAIVGDFETDVALEEVLAQRRQPASCEGYGSRARIVKIGQFETLMLLHDVGIVGMKMVERHIVSVPQATDKLVIFQCDPCIPQLKWREPAPGQAREGFREAEKPSPRFPAEGECNDR